MTPPYKITTDILKQITSVSEKIGEVSAKYLDKQTPQLRKQHRIKTIHSSLQIEMEFIHPFSDGNGRMGRLWQSVILMEQYPVLEFLPFETLISQNQDDYYKVLSLSDKKSKSTLLSSDFLKKKETKQK